MPTYNKDLILKKLENFNKLPIGDRYLLSQKIFNVFKMIDQKEIEQIFIKTGFHKIYESAEKKVSFLIHEGMIIVPEHEKRQLSLIFKEHSRDCSGDFFEVCDLADSISDSNLEKALIIGFLMEKEKMTIIQTYNLITNKFN